MTRAAVAIIIFKVLLSGIAGVGLGLVISPWAYSTIRWIATPAPRACFGRDSIGFPVLGWVELPCLDWRTSAKYCDQFGCYITTKEAADRWGLH